MSQTKDQRAVNLYALKTLVGILKDPNSADRDADPVEADRQIKVADQLIAEVEKTMHALGERRHNEAGSLPDRKMSHFTMRELHEVALIATGRSGDTSDFEKYKRKGLLKDAADGWIDLTRKGQSVLEAGGYQYDPKIGWKRVVESKARLDGAVHYLGRYDGELATGPVTIETSGIGPHNK